MEKEKQNTNNSITYIGPSVKICPKAIEMKIPPQEAQYSCGKMVNNNGTKKFVPICIYCSGISGNKPICTLSK